MISIKTNFYIDLGKCMILYRIKNHDCHIFNNNYNADNNNRKTTTITTFLGWSISRDKDTQAMAISTMDVSTLTFLTMDTLAPFWIGIH